MLLRCGHCQTPIQLSGDETAVSRCPSCETSLSHAAVVVEDLSPGQKVAHFELIEKAGAGTYGSVWKALDCQLDRVVALKLPKVEFLDPDRLLREAQAAAQINHPAIVDVYEICVQGTQPYIAAEFIHGLTLERWLQQNEPTPNQAAEICRDLAEAIHVAHGKGVIHRDLKPGNVMVDESNRVHITDFGIAKRDNGEATITLDGQIIGTPAYMSPEQAIGNSNQVTQLTDVYSLGAVLYRILAGRPPFEGSTHDVVSRVPIQEPPALGASVPPQLQAICAKAMSKEASERYESAEEFAADLNNFLTESKVAAPAIRRPSLYDKANQWIAAHPVLTLLCAMAPILVAIKIAVTPPPEEPSSYPVPSDRLLNVVFRFNEPVTRVACIPMSELTSLRDPRREGFDFDKLSSNQVEAKLESGVYCIVAESSPGTFHEVLRRVPSPATKMGDFAHNSWEVFKNGQVAMPTISLFDTPLLKNMLPVPGGLGAFGPMEDDEPSLEPSREPCYSFKAYVRPFLLGDCEVSEFDYSRGLEKFKILRTSQSTRPAVPAVNLDINQVLAFLEYHGCRLPTEFEYEFAATKGGLRRYPDLPPAPILFKPPFAFPKAHPGPYGHFFLFSGAAELTSSNAINAKWQRENDPKLSTYMFNYFTVRGIHSEYMKGVMEEGPAFTRPIHRGSRNPGNLSCPHIGFRAARSQTPRWNWDTLDAEPAGAGN